MIAGRLRYPLCAALLVGAVALPGLAYADELTQNDLGGGVRSTSYKARGSAKRCR